MKMIPEHFEALKARLDALPLTPLGRDPWSMFHTVYNTPRIHPAKHEGVNDTFGAELYEYLNDSHIETALKRLF